LVALAVLALAGGCTTHTAAPTPDPLLPLLTAATSDAAAAAADAKAFADNAPTLAVIAAVRRQQAAALRTEVDRAAAVTATPTTTTTAVPRPPTDEATATAALLTGMTAAQREAARLMPDLPRYRAGLVGSVAAGCASLAEALDSTAITPTTATSAGPADAAPAAGAAPTVTADPTTTPKTTPPVSTSRPTADTTTALQQALATEHAALWLYGTASAFVTGSAETEIIAAMGSVQSLRDATEHRLSAGGVTPQPAQPAYLVPSPVTNQASALAALAVAESDATVAWRSVLEHSDDPGLRAAALSALIDSAVRETRWRRLAGQTPASVAMPGSAT
jgi:hypothetical protein